MAKASNLKITSFDHDELKSSLIEFLQSTEEFGDFNYEGSAINAFIDLLTRNSTYSGFLANMLANESFIGSAKLRQNVVAHAEKLSYVPTSVTAAKLVCNIVVTPTSVVDIPSSIVMDAGTSFLYSSGGTTFTFVSHEDVRLIYSASTQKYSASDVTLYQGQRLSNAFFHVAGTRVVIPNQRADTSTLLVTVAPSNAIDDKVVYTKATSITELTELSRVYFIGEDSESGNPYIEFGRNLIGVEPSNGSIVEISYINVEEEHANGVGSLIAATPIEGYSNIALMVTTASYGGVERESRDSIRFLAPKHYQMQDRALSEFDYIPFIKKNFPFIKSINAWGGEKNNPPLYGNVVLCILPKATNVITESAKTEIINFVDDYNVGSITPVIVEPDIFYIDLVVNFDYNPRLTSSTFNKLSSQLVDVVENYNDEEIGDFLSVYNESELVSRLKDVKGITTITIDKTVYKNIDVLQFNDPSYEISFNNAVVPGSALMEDFSVNINATEQKLIDDEEGNIVLSYKLNGATVQRNVGTIDYDSGEVQFSINMIQDESTVKFYITPVEENFFVADNAVIYVDGVSTGLVDRRIRT